MFFSISSVNIVVFFYFHFSVGHKFYKYSDCDIENDSFKKTIDETVLCELSFFLDEFLNVSKR